MVFGCFRLPLAARRRQPRTFTVGRNMDLQHHTTFNRRVHVERIELGSTQAEQAEEVEQVEHFSQPIQLEQRLRRTRDNNALPCPRSRLACNDGGCSLLTRFGRLACSRWDWILGPKAQYWLECGGCTGTSPTRTFVSASALR